MNTPQARDLDEIQHAIEHAAHFLPSQGPITAFVHHNTLHAFEDLPFEQALPLAGQVYRCQPYLSEEQFQQRLEQGKIDLNDLSEILIRDLGDEADRLIGSLGTRFHLRQAMLQYRIGMLPNTPLRWLIAESDGLRRFRRDVAPEARQRWILQTQRWIMRHLDDVTDPPHGLHEPPVTAPLHRLLADLVRRWDGTAPEDWDDAIWEEFSLNLLWRVCHQGVHGLSSDSDSPPLPVRHRDLLLDVCGEDSDRLVNEVLIRFCSSYLDQGYATWTMPERDQGFLAAFAALHGGTSRPSAAWMKGVAQELDQLQANRRTALESIAQSLDHLSVPLPEREAFLSETLLALRGWAGMIWQLESQVEWAKFSPPPGTLIEYLAVRLILERAALQHLAKRSLDIDAPVEQLRDQLRSRFQRRVSDPLDQRAYQVFQLAQVAGWATESLHGLNKAEWGLLVRELESFGPMERRKIYHAANEARYVRETLDAFSQHHWINRPRSQRPTFQVVCCIDDREESFRRHLEEVAPDCETFGLAGFYSVAMYYRGAADAQFRPLCPVTIRPRHYVQEEVLSAYQAQHLRRAERRRVLATAARRWHLGSRTFLGGIVTALLGSLASIPLVMRVLFPHATARIRARLGRMVQPPVETQLALYRSESAPGPEPGQLGYSIEEMTDIAQRVLRETGLGTRLSRLVAFLGHGSSSLNNPHESAYNCGACSGGRGGPNARAFAQMINDPRVRQQLAGRGVPIATDVWFLGGYHNTCDDSVTWFDLDQMPATHQSDFAVLTTAINAARRCNAHERCRRFESVSLTLSESDALRHVQQRSEDLSQTRPEYNHATNALCVVGRRDRSRGLFLDRRAFVTSYDCTADDESCSTLLQILQAAVPVCAGINLEYYFSTVDPSGFGCGSKLPHNITSMLGVMEGAASDLRPGLSQQMVEIHEPYRLLFLIEATPQTMHSILQRNANIARLVEHRWVHLATLDPDSSTIHRYLDGEFVRYEPGNTPLPTVQRSQDWYRGWRDHLGFASIANPVAATSTSHEEVR